MCNFDLVVLIVLIIKLMIVMVVFDLKLLLDEVLLIVISEISEMCGVFFWVWVGS